jgi:hypothetical protein
MKTKTSTAIVIAAASIILGESFSTVATVTKRGLLFSTTSSTDPSPSSQSSYNDEIFSFQDAVESSSSWSEADDWSSLSKTSSSTTNYNSVVYDEACTNIVDNVMVTGSNDDIWMQDVVDEIHNSFSTLDDHPPLYDTSFEKILCKTKWMMKLPC